MSVEPFDLEKKHVGYGLTMLPLWEVFSVEGWELDMVVERSWELVRLQKVKNARRKRDYLQ